MNDDILAGNWKQFRGKIKEQWGKLTDDELDQIDGKRDQMVGLLQKQYGYSKEDAQAEYDDFVDTLNEDQRELAGKF